MEKCKNPSPPYTPATATHQVQRNRTKRKKERKKETIQRLVRDPNLTLEKGDTSGIIQKVNGNSTKEQKINRKTKRKRNPQRKHNTEMEPQIENGSTIRKLKLQTEAEAQIEIESS